MKKKSTDNVSVVFIAFKNFENKIKDPTFVYQPMNKCQDWQENYDINVM